MTAFLSDAAGKKVARLGFGAMRLTGPGVWGEPDDRRECVRVVHRAVGLGVQLIDTADSYGSYVSEEIIREAIPLRSGGVAAGRASGVPASAGPDESAPARSGARRPVPVWPGSIRRSRWRARSAS
ncbi:aldo/keto reductase [Streptomyces rimosus]|uniref:aldo/keto reductase n=1 Tax=Streptomyces rimosus TaxID=1927 RepID=UPI0037980F34